jgi:hypothetical protein
MRKARPPQGIDAVRAAFEQQASPTEAATPAEA